MSLLQVRQLYNLSLKELAEKLNVSNQMVSMWERNKKPISKEKLKKLSELFEIPDYYFVDELNEFELLNLQKLKFENDYKKIVVEVKKEDGTSTHMQAKQFNTNTISNMRLNSFFRKKLTMHNNIESQLLPPYLFKEDMENEKSNYIISNENRLLQEINLYENVSRILLSRKIPHKVLSTILVALDFAYEVDNDLEKQHSYDEKLLTLIYEAIIEYKQ